jgi:hypothetical protein
MACIRLHAVDDGISTQGLRHVQAHLSLVDREDFPADGLRRLHGQNSHCAHADDGCGLSQLKLIAWDGMQRDSSRLRQRRLFRAYVIRKA